MAKVLPRGAARCKCWAHPLNALKRARKVSKYDENECLND